MSRSGASSSHGDWNIRRIAVETFAERFNDSAEAPNAICEATHDDVDWVALSLLYDVYEVRIV